MATTIGQFTYSDEYDVDHYPISESDHAIISTVVGCSEWKYFVTIHGKIYAAMEPCVLTLADLKQVAESNRLRWVSINDCRVDAKDFAVACNIKFLNSIALEISELSIGLKHEGE